MAKPPVPVLPTSRRLSPEEAAAAAALPDLKVERERARKMGRPLKLTPAVQAVIVGQVRRGLYPEIAARMAGITKPTLLSWLGRGAAQKKGEFRDFLSAIEEAQAAFESDGLERLDRADEGGRWTAWKLERLFPERYAPRHVIQEVAQAQVDQEFRAALDRLRRAFADEPATLRRALEAIEGGEFGDDVPGGIPGGTPGAPPA
jgi:hypothetical protein